jgi:chromosome segregation ATPase
LAHYKKEAKMFADKQRQFSENLTKLYIRGEKIMGEEKINWTNLGNQAAQIVNFLRPMERAQELFHSVARAETTLKEINEDIERQQALAGQAVKKAEAKAKGIVEGAQKQADGLLSGVRKERAKLEADIATAKDRVKTAQKAADQAERDLADLQEDHSRKLADLAQEKQAVIADVAKAKDELGAVKADYEALAARFKSLD